MPTLNFKQIKDAVKRVKDFVDELPDIPGNPKPDPPFLPPASPPAQRTRKFRDLKDSTRVLTLAEAIDAVDEVLHLGWPSDVEGLWDWVQELTIGRDAEEMAEDIYKKMQARVLGQNNPRQVRKNVTTVSRKFGTGWKG